MNSGEHFAGALAALEDAQGAACTRCKGEGWTSATEIYQDGSYATGRECPRCHGSGREPRRICEECECPIDSEPHLQHCPEAIRG